MSFMFERVEQTLSAMLENAKGTYGVSIYHLESGQEFHNLADEVFYSASVIKVPIMAAVFAEVAEGNVTLAEKVVIRQEDMVTGSGCLQHMTPGIEVSIHDLISLMIIHSDNTATNVLADRIGIPVIQKHMRAFGMTKSEFHNKLQVLPVNRTGFNVITPRETNDLMIKIAKAQIVSWKACCEMVRIMKLQAYNDSLPSLLPYREKPIGATPDWEMAHKTGFFQGVDHDVALFYLPNATFAISVLSKDIENHREARHFMGQIGRAIYDIATA